MDQEYDVIILGTGLKECILSGLLSVNGKKVLHIDRNSYYGGESASLNLKQLYEQFKAEAKIDEEKLGKSKSYNVDLCPKFIMACGNLVKMLLHTKVTRYLQFKSIAGSFVFKDDKIHKVPSTPGEAMSSPLMGIFQKRNCRSFLQWCADYKQEDPKTHSGMDAEKTTAAAVYKHFGCDENTQAFIGHAMALQSDDGYLTRPVAEILPKITLYAYSVSQYGFSPYIYPLWGLAGLPEGFSRLSAVYGGTYMLNTPVTEILYNSDGKVTGIKTETGTATCKQLIGDPSYFPKKVKKVGQVGKTILIMDHPLKNSGDVHSAQVIIPYKHVGRKSDVYISCVSNTHEVTPKGKYVALISAAVETSDPKSEVAFAKKLAGDYLEEFFFVSDLYEPTNDPVKEQVFITKSYDPSTHFESATDEVIALYKLITGTDLDLTISADASELKE